MATHSSTLVWKIPQTVEHGGLQSMGVTKSWTQLSASTHSFPMRHLSTGTRQQPPLPMGHCCSSWPQSPLLPNVSPSLLHSLALSVPWTFEFPVREWAPWFLTREAFHSPSPTDLNSQAQRESDPSKAPSGNRATELWLCQ